MTAVPPNPPLPHLWFTDPELRAEHYIDTGDRWIRARVTNSGLWLASAGRMHRPMEYSDDDVAGEVAAGFTGLDDRFGKHGLPRPLLRLANGPGGSARERVADCSPMPTTVIVDGEARVALRLEFGGPFGLATIIDGAWVHVLAPTRDTYRAVELETVPTPSRPPPPLPVPLPPGRYWTGGGPGTVSRRTRPV